VVVDDFDVVAIGVEHMGGVVAGVIARALTGLAVTSIPGRCCVGVESAYVVVCARERDVDALRRTAGVMPRLADGGPRRSPAWLRRWS